MPLSKIDSDSLNSPITAVDLSYTGTLTGGTGVVNLGSGQVYKDASGNVGIGSVPVNSRRLTLNTSGQTDLSIVAGSTNYAQLLFGYTGSDAKGIISYYNSNNLMQFYTNGTERARIDSSGILSVGCTTGIGYVTQLNLSADSGTNKWATGPYSGNPAAYIIAANTNFGVYLPSTSATSWTSASDERLKENLLPIEDALSKVSLLRAVTGNFIADEEKTRKPFLIAQDVQAVLPEAVSVTPDGTHLGVSYTEVIPLLTAAIKELKAIVDAQGAEIAALKGTP